MWGLLFAFIGGFVVCFILMAWSVKLNTIGTLCVNNLDPDERECLFLVLSKEVVEFAYGGHVVLEVMLDETPSHK